MKSYTSLKAILAEFFPLHRTLVSDDQDRTLQIVGSYLPESAGYTLETYAPGAQAWTWRVPERYVVHEAYLETEEGRRIVDFKDNPLHIVSYSLPVDRLLNWQELEPHLYFNEKRPQAVPWVFKYYERDWGFCLSKVSFDQLSRDGKYRAVIRAEFISDPAQGFRVATAVIHPEGGPNPQAGEMIVQAHTCHPMQANDDGAGVVTAIQLARRLAEKRVLFCGNHGVVVIGRTVAEAFDDLYFLERACQVQILAMSTGRPLRNVKDEVAKATFGNCDMGQYAHQHFSALKRLLDRAEPDYAQ